MADLYPTKSRLALLGDVAEGLVWQHDDGQSVVSIGGSASGVKPTRVTSRIAELEQAGWVELHRYAIGRSWTLTDAGRAVLAASGGEA